MNHDFGAEYLEEIEIPVYGEMGIPRCNFGSPFCKGLEV